MDVVQVALGQQIRLQMTKCCLMPFQGFGAMLDGAVSL
jgi:hypothetical protein